MSNKNINFLYEVVTFITNCLLLTMFYSIEVTIVSRTCWFLNIVFSTLVFFSIRKENRRNFCLVASVLNRMIKPMTALALLGFVVINLFDDNTFSHIPPTIYATWFYLKIRKGIREDNEGVEVFTKKMFDN